jgi:3-dehydroquinate synthase
MDAATQVRTFTRGDSEELPFGAGNSAGVHFIRSVRRARRRLRSTGHFRRTRGGPPAPTAALPAIERHIQVTFRHQIFFTHGVFCTSNKLLRTVLSDGNRRCRKKVLFVMDSNLAQAQPRLLDQIREYVAVHSKVLEMVTAPILIEGGEGVKNSHRHVAELELHIKRRSLDRHSYVVAIGGGALLDMVGFSTAIAHRGVRHVRIPSTTLSQDDSGVGIKNGINAFGKKNFIGTFAPPFAVINDFDLLKSLSRRDKRAGYAEAVKVALIRDATFFVEMEREVEKLRIFEPRAMERLIYRCAELHVDHIAHSGDPFEFGSARPLDFGHWSAHKLEQLSNYRIRHGEAVAIGIALDAIYSRFAGLLDRQSVERTLKLLERMGFELFAPELVQVDAKGRLKILEGLDEFRQHLGGRLTISLLKGIGHELAVHKIKRSFLREAVRELASRQRTPSGLDRCRKTGN